ncbi:MAG: hypothetical protein U7M05_12300 [Candidatus Igneacidithiobacillus chanchocoensis]
MSTTDTTNVVLQTALATAEAVAPTALAAASASSPQNAAIVALAPVALQLLQAATQAQAAGSMSAAELATQFANVAKAIQDTHDAWAAMNKSQA